MTPRCPRCLGPLAGAVCSTCGATYRSLRGIPDLRVADDGYLDNVSDWAYASRLAEAYDHLDFRGLLGRYFDLGPALPADLRRRQVDHIANGPARAARWLDEVPGDGTATILDLGCGTGSLLSVAAARGLPAVGVDIALRWLVLARKRLDEAGHARVPLICACAEHLPIADGTIGRVFGGDVIEHVADIPATLAEAHRVLRPGGSLFLATPNRFSLAPEPHVGVWGVGYLPRRWMGPYVAWRRKLDFNAIHTLGFGGWKRMLADSPFGGGEIVTPGPPADEVASYPRGKRMLARAYHRLIASSPGRAAARRVGPMFHLVARRGPGLPPGSTPR